MNDFTMENLLHACLDGEDEDAPELNPVTPDCPSFGKFEAHVRGTRFLTAEEMRHVNRCPDRCQGVLEQFRNEFRPPAQRPSVGAPQKLAAHGQGSEFRYPAVVQSRSGDLLGEASVVVRDGPFLTDMGYVVFRMDVMGPIFQPEMMPLEVSMADVEAADTVFRFDLPTQVDEIVKLKMPEYLKNESRWKDLSATGLPFTFSLSPLGKGELLSGG